MAELVKQILGKPIQLADQVTKAAAEASSFKQECSEIKSKTEKLAGLLRQAARASSDLYERPTRRIIDDTEQTLDKALALVLKCRSRGLMKRVLSIIPAAAFRRMSSQLENSIGDVSWLLRVSSRGGEHLGLPPIAANEPILGLIWEQIAALYTGSPEERSDAANSLVSLARDSGRNGKLIIEEGGIGPLLKLAKEGKEDGQENAVRAIGILGRDHESVDYMVHAGVCGAFQKILKEGSMKVQAEVAWAVSELAAHGHPKCRDVFVQNNIIHLLVSHLAFETVQEHSKYAVAGAVMNRSTSINSMHNVVTTTMAMKKLSPVRPAENGGGNNKPNGNHHRHQRSLSLSGGLNLRGRELEDPKTKARMKAMAARALWHLAKGSSAICRSITESRALLCFAVLLEKGPEEVRLNSAMALMEITAVAEKDADLRRSAFKPTSPACKAVVDQLVRIIEKEAEAGVGSSSSLSDSDSYLLIPCIISIGNLARTFRATETRMIAPLVRLLQENHRPEFSREAAAALAKFACSDNYLHLEHCKAIIGAGGTKHLIQLVYFGKQAAKAEALVVLAYIAKHVPESVELGQAEALAVLEWASKQSALTQDEKVETLLQEAKGRLELYQSKGMFQY
ncbi:hypothetical protein SAY86_031645 [Trapa natans]|uniref:DUF7792 domain-containing protein n=1 Tax=Trapa natans TaxID=22666 RepID=A0AAN7LSA7_TRANT|nr:hypothetical protein SAY86_031645 [Trapa natans]